MLKRRALLKALVLGTALAFPVARFTVTGAPKRITFDIRYGVGHVMGVDTEEECHDLLHRFRANGIPFVVRQWEPYV